MSARNRTAFMAGEHAGSKAESRMERFADAMRTRVFSAAYASEMYCSLKYEDYRGCPYHVFTSRQIAFLSSALCVLSAASIVLGA